MKKIFTFLSVLAVYFTVNSQTVILNNSFENWTTVNGKMYPNDWTCQDSVEVKNGATQRVTGGSVGTYAIQLGCYLDNTAIVGSTIGIVGAVSVKPLSLLFDYKVFNATPNNGVSVDVTLKDGGSLMKAYSFSTSSTNNSTYKTGFIDFKLTSLENPVFYYISITYLNISGNIDEYMVLDNIRFSQTASVNGVNGYSNIAIGPNPADNFIKLTNTENYHIKSARLISMDGRATEVNIENSVIDISAISKGIYILEILDENNNLLKREKMDIRN